MSLETSRFSICPTPRAQRERPSLTRQRHAPTAWRRRHAGVPEDAPASITAAQPQPHRHRQEVTTKEPTTETPQGGDFSMATTGDRYLAVDNRPAGGHWGHGGASRRSSMELTRLCRAARRRVNTRPAT